MTASEEKIMRSSEKFVLDIEKRFKKLTGATENLASFPLKPGASNIEINKNKSKEFSEVFTPLWLVDKMIKQVDIDHANVQTLDLCSGYGQFSLRMMRRMYKLFPFFDIRKFLKRIMRSLSFSCLLAISFSISLVRTLPPSSW